MTFRLIVFRSTATARWFSTASATAASVTEGKAKTLYSKLAELNSKPDSDINVKETIDEWVSQENPIKRFDITNQIKSFRQRKKYNAALQLSEWLENSNVGMNNADRAIQIDLLAKIRGIDSAELYFNSLQKSAKTIKTYGSLLNCYRKEKLLDKALELFAKMKELGFASTLNYNNVMGLYLNTNLPEQVPLLFEEMQKENLKPDIFTYNQLINSYAAQKDLDAVEKVVEDMEANDICNWFTYGNVATIYINAGFHQKATSFIEKMTAKNVRDYEYFHTLIILYKKISDLSGVKRTWRALQSVFPTTSNTSYLLMLLALAKLDGLENLEKCFREWESGYKMYDVRISNVLLEAYLQKDMIGEANALYELMVTKGNKPNLRTMKLLTGYHIKNHEVGLALNYLEMGAAMVKRERGTRFPNDETVEMFLKLFKEKNDGEGARRFCDIMKKIDRLDSAEYEALLSSEGADGELQAQS